MPLIEVPDFLNHRWMITKPDKNLFSEHNYLLRVGGELFRPAKTIEFKSRVSVSPILCQLYGGIFDYLSRQICAASFEACGCFDRSTHDGFVVVPIEL